MESMIKRINKQSVVILACLSLITIFFADWRFSLSIIIGGLVGIGNLKGIAWAANALLGTEKARTKMLVLSFFRLIVIFSLLLILVIIKVINPYGLVAGFTAVFLIIIKEGLITSKKISKQESSASGDSEQQGS